MMKKLIDWWRQLRRMAPFTPNEAWGIFRLAALGEAVGWALLISGILIRQHGGLGSGVAVPIAGRIHGTLFLLYFAALLATVTSLNWSFKRLFVAIVAGVFPFGTLLFEQWVSWQLHRNHSRLFICSTALQLLRTA